MQDIPPQYQGLAINKTRSLIIMLIWLAIGIWGINFASAHREFKCQPLEKDAACLLITQRLLDSSDSIALLKSEIRQAKLIEIDGQQMSPDSYQVVLETDQGTLWLSESDSENVRKKEALLEEINAYLKSASKQYAFKSSYPLFFFVLSAVFIAISLFLLSGIYLARRLG